MMNYYIVIGNICNQGQLLLLLLKFSGFGFDHYFEVLPAPTIQQLEQISYLLVTKDTSCIP